MDCRDKIQLKSGVFNLLTYTGPSPVTRTLAITSWVNLEKMANSP